MKKKKNILVLHGDNQDAETLKGRMKPMLTKLQDSVQFDFLDAPFVVQDAKEPTKRQWWTQVKHTLEWDHDTGHESIKLISDFIRKTYNPDTRKLDAILGFSQGGCILQ